MRRASTGLPHLMVPVRDEATLRRAARDDRACATVCEATDAESLYLFVVRGPGDVMARMFDRSSRIGEDPATASAAGPLGAYLAEHGLAGLPGRVAGPGRATGRPSRIEVEELDEGPTRSVSVGGGIRSVGSARSSSRLSAHTRRGRLTGSHVTSGVSTTSVCVVTATPASTG
ncbi:MAG: PhzF family phenazine biosynthesis protein [Actinomycetota bacterium]